MSEQTPGGLTGEQADKIAWFMSWRRTLGCLATLCLVSFFLRGSQIDRFSAATGVPQWAAVAFAVSLGLVALAMTFEGFVRRPGRFGVVGCAMIAFGLNFNWADAEQGPAAVAFVVIGIAIEIVLFRYTGKNRPQPLPE